MTTPTSRTWPSLQDVVDDFYDGALARPRELLRAFTATGAGSGRRAGPRALQWQALFILAAAALEAGAEDLLFAAHAARQGAEGAPIRAGDNAPDANPRPWLVERRLMSPSSHKLRQIVFTDFGVLLDALPGHAHVKPRRKLSSRGGSGRGQEVPGPLDWKGLSNYIDTMLWLRNAAAHGDAAKLARRPPSCEGDLWLTRVDGTWSVQQPHALTALRVVLGTFNALAVPLWTIT